MEEFNEVDKTLWCGNLSDEVTEECLYELFLQAGPLEKVKIVTDKETNKPKYAFITFCHGQSVPYTIELMNGIQLYDKQLRLQTRPGSRHNQSGSQGPVSNAAMPHSGVMQPLHNEMARSMSAPDHIQNLASDMYSQMMLLNQLGAGLTNPLAAQSMLSSGNHYPTKEAQRQRIHQQQQLAAQQQQQQLMEQQRNQWLMQQQQMGWNKRTQHPHWY
ncbi:RNA-binding protein 7 [Lamellibrachia satsuma]|nr:RNA-binding protein 7 [Lamellibrachia satsuma]